MSKDSSGIPTVSMLAVLAGMFTQQGFQGKGMRGLLTDDATTMHQRLISEHMRQNQGGRLSAMIDNAWQGGGIPTQGSVAFGMDPTFNTMMELEDSQGGGSEPVEVKAILDTMMRLEGSQGRGLPAVRLTQEHGIHMMVKGYQDSGGGLPETRVVIPGIMHDKQAGSQMFPAMEQDSGAEYFDMKTIWQGSGGGPIEHHILAVAEAIEEPVIRFAA